MIYHDEHQQDDPEYVFINADLRITKHRRLAYILLKNASEPITADSLFLLMKEQDSAVSLSTVYRIIDAFLDKGLAERASLMDEGKALYESSNGSHHHHLRCLICNHTMVVEGCPLEEYEKKLENKTHFRVTGHRLELTGYCAECAVKMDQVTARKTETLQS